VKVSLLGPVSAESGGAEVNLGGRQQRAVFALLALNAGRVVPMDRLVDELWRDEPPSRATLSLQSYVSRLRRVLAGAAQIVTRPPGWLLALDPDDVDVTRFTALIARARTLPPAQAVPVLREALDLWRGEALADLRSLSFAGEEATRLAELRLSATGMLLDAMLAIGEADSVVAEARRFVAAHPFHEHGWQALMLALYRTGRQSEAVAAAAELRRVLADELGLDPSPETRELEQRILRQDPALHPRSVANGGAAPPASTTPDGPDQAPVGRAEALAVLAQAVTEGGRLLLLDAPAGLGKSTMLRALADRMRAAGGLVLRAAGVGAGTPALWPWVAIVRELVAHRPEAAAEGIPAAAARALLGDGGADGPMSRTTLYRGVVDMLAAAAATQPVGVLLDDAHWVDADTLTLLALAVDELAGRGVTFAVAVRSYEPGAATVRDLAGRIRRDLVRTVPLPGLDRAAVAELVRRLTGELPDPAVVAAITTRTVGNPLFIGELVRLLTSERRLDTANVNSALPEHVRDVLRRRLERLPGQTVTLLTVIALAGGPADVELLARVTGLDPDAVLDGCEVALTARLLVEDADGFALTHDLIRQTLAEQVSSARRIRLHAKLAEALQARATLTPQQVLDVARHLTRAAPIVGPAAAVPYLMTASDDALSRYAHEEAQRLLQEALDRLDAVPDPAERAALAAPVRGKLSTVRTWTSGTAAEPPPLDAAVPPPTDPDRTAGWLSTLLMGCLGGGYGRSIAIAERALADGLPPIGRLGAHFVIGWAAFHCGRIDQSDEHLRRFEELSDEDAALRIPGSISTVEVSVAGYASLIAHIRGDEDGADRAMALAESRAAVRAEPNGIHVHLHHAWLAAMRGDAARAGRHARDCVAASERFAFPMFALHGAVLAAWSDALLGDGSAAARMDEAHAAYVASGVRLWVSMYLLLRAEAHAAAGAAETAAELVDQSRAAALEFDDVCRSPRLQALSKVLQGSAKR
jgi:DNA-binding SARP family transcriptional activator